MSPFSGLFGKKPSSSPQSKHESDATYLSRTVRENAASQNFSALTFRFSHALGLSLPTAEQARMIAAYDYPGTASLYRYSERELSAAAVYMASYVCGVPKSVSEVARVAGVGEDRVKALCGELYGAQERLGNRDWGDVFGGLGGGAVGDMRRKVAFPPL